VFAQFVGKCFFLNIVNITFLVLLQCCNTFGRSNYSVFSELQGESCSRLQMAGNDKMCTYQQL
jgi:hypothetical protein